MLFLCILGFNNVVGWQKENRELFALTSCGAGWGCCFSWLQSFSGFGEKWCCWKPCLSPHYELHGNAHAHRASWPHSHCQHICAGVTHRENKRMQEHNLPIGRLASRMGKQEESEMPGKGTKPGDWMFLSGRQAAAQATQQKCPSPQGTWASWKHSVRFLGPAGQREGVSHDHISAYLPICHSLPCL